MLDMIISFLREYSYSLRSNGSERKSEELAIRILAEIEGQTGSDVLTITGLRPQLLGEISQIGMELKKLRVGYFNNSIKNCPDYLPATLHTSSGLPSAIILPPFTPPSGPISTI